MRIFPGLVTTDGQGLGADGAEKRTREAVVTVASSIQHPAPGVENGFDVVVIGMGVAGAVAALKARKEGKTVALIARAPGATALSSGAVDPLSNPTPGVQHPASIVRDALAFAREVFSSLGLTSGPADDGALILPTVLGAWKTALLAQATQAAADLDAIKGREWIVVRFADVESAAWRTGAELARQAAKRLGADPAPVREIEVELLAASRRLGVFEAAAALDDNDSLAALVGERIARKIGDRASAFALLDPVMGLRDYARVMREVGRSAGVACAEMLPTVPSVPGRRWQTAIEAALTNAGVAVIRAHASAFAADGRTVTSVRPANVPEVRAKAFVLGSGRFVGGGIRRDSEFFEPLFGIPVHCAGAPDPDVPVGDLAGRRISDRHAAFTAGVRVDDRMRPLDRFGSPVFENVFAAGAVIGDPSASDSPSGMGHAIVSGFQAGCNAAR